MLMVFQKLDVVNAHAVAVDDFMEGLMRMRQDVQGLDVASAKSLMRMLVRDIAVVKRNCKNLYSCGIHTVERLRGCRVATDGDLGQGHADDVDLVKLAVQARTQVLQRQIEFLQTKVDRVRDHNMARR